jgi:dihydroorotase
MLQLARETGVRLHICRISSAAGVELVRQAKQDGLALSCDVSMNHIHLSEMDIAYFDSNCHLIPPLRNQRDREALRKGLQDGVIDSICSNHSPVDDDAKQLPFAEAEAGATGLELLLPLVLKWSQQEKITVSDAIAKVTTNAAHILNIDAGHLTPGAAADICIYDPAEYWVVEAGALKSQGKNTPFIGMELQGKVRYTLVNGKIVYQAT